MRSLLVILLLAGSIARADSPWRTYAGGYSTNWKTIGPHGHDQPCPIYRVSGGIVYPDGTFVPLSLTPACDDYDFGRGNLDNSIGYRLGRERDFASFGIVRIAGGAEATFTDTEYNISQRDLGILAGAFTAGVDLERWGARVGIRYGLGSFLTTNLRYGVHSFKEIGLTIPLTSGSAIRLTRGTAVHSQVFNQKFRLAGSSEIASSATAKEFGLLLVGRPGAGPSHWNFAALTGVSRPSSLNLSRAAYHRLTVLRDVGESPFQLQLSWTSAAHESKVEGVFNGYPKNLRSKTIDSFGLAVRAHRDVRRGLSAHATLGGEIAEWTDPHGLLVAGAAPNLHVVEGGIEVGANVGAGLRWMVSRGTGIELMAEQTWWPGLGLEERRTGIGLVINR